MSKVSVIMPAYNAEAFIAESLQSVLAQTFVDWELIIIDDGSTDNTKNVIQPFLADARIKYLWQENGRQGKARNAGIRIARGSYLAFLDADDIWMPEKLEKQLGFIGSNNYDLVYSNSYVFRKLPLQSALETMRTPIRVYEGSKDVDLFFQGNKIPILTVLTRKSVVEEAGGFTEESGLIEDYHLWMKLLIRGARFAGQPEIFAAYRLSPVSVSNNDRMSFAQSIDTLRNIQEEYPAYKDRVRKNWQPLLSGAIVHASLSTRKIYHSAIREYLSLSQWGWLSPFFLVVDRIFGRRVSRKLLSVLLKKF